MNDFRGVHQRTPPSIRSGQVTDLLPVTSSSTTRGNQRRVRQRIRKKNHESSSNDRSLWIFVGIASGMIFLVCFVAGNLINYWSSSSSHSHSHNHWDAAKMNRIHLLRQELAKEKEDMIHPAGAGSRKVDEPPAHPIGEVGMAKAGASMEEEDGNQFVVNNEPQPIVQGITIKKHHNDEESDDEMVHARKLREKQHKERLGRVDKYLAEQPKNIPLQHPQIMEAEKAIDELNLKTEKRANAEQEPVSPNQIRKIPPNNVAPNGLDAVKQEIVREEAWRADTKRKQALAGLKHVNLKPPNPPKEKEGFASVLSRWSREDGQSLRTMTDEPIDRSVNDTHVPFVFMVYKRTEYLQHAMESVMNSDFPRDRLPIVISHDGRVPEMVEYVESLKKDFRVIQLFHPFACYDHPHSFPGNDTSLNIDYKGDTYGNPRSDWATCCKHHFTWMMLQVFRLPELKDYNTFFFSEEDYIVAPTIYHSIAIGLNEMAANEERTANGFFALGFDIFNGGRAYKGGATEGQFEWEVREFRTGPMAINRKAFGLIEKGSKQYCTEDEYNWDWSLVHMMMAKELPFSVLQPRSALVQHIGKIGMHTTDHATAMDRKKRGLAVNSRKMASQLDTSFEHFLQSRWTATRGINKISFKGHRPHKVSGGFGHPKDHEHCLELFGLEEKLA